GEDCGIWHTCNPDLSFCSGYEAVYGKGKHGMLKQWEKVFNEWVLNSFDVKADYAKKFANPYLRRFDEYRRVFNNEVEQLSNEYILRIGKKGYVPDDVWEKCGKTMGEQHTHDTMKGTKKNNYGKARLKKLNMSCLWEMRFLKICLTKIHSLPPLFEFRAMLSGDKLTSRDKSLDLSAFKLSYLFSSFLSSGSSVVGDRMGFSESIVTSH
nr:phospholipase-like protein [Tanacetum cinerariifolium]GEZ23243.1 phospholipase-like protein [Tanacetum cinerariifolium]